MITVALISLVLSALALGLSGWAIYYTHQTHKINVDRRHDERTPRIRATWASKAHVITLHLDHGGPFTGAKVQILHDNLCFADDDADSRIEVVNRRSLWTIGEPWRLPPLVQRIDPPGSHSRIRLLHSVRVLVTCTDQATPPWDLTVVADFGQVPLRLRVPTDEAG